jgi:hypothetical protein
MMDIAVLWEKKLLQNVSVGNQKFSVCTIDEYKGLCPQQDEMKLRRF